MTRVKIPSPLYSYTGNRAVVEASPREPATLASVLDDLERQFAGIRFRMIDEQDRIRPHIKMFIAGRLANDLSARVAPSEEVMIVAALSGG